MLRVEIGLFRPVCPVKELHSLWLPDAAREQGRVSLQAEINEEYKYTCLCE